MVSLYTVEPQGDFSFDIWPNKKVDWKKWEKVKITKKLYNYYQRFYPSKFKFLSTTWEESTSVATAEFVKVIREKGVYIKSLDKGFIDAKPNEIVKLAITEARSMERSYKLWFEFGVSEADYLAQEWGEAPKELTEEEKELEELRATYETLYWKPVANNKKNDAEWIEKKIVEKAEEESEEEEEETQDETWDNENKDSQETDSEEDELLEEIEEEDGAESEEEGGEWTNIPLDTETSDADKKTTETTANGAEK